MAEECYPFDNSPAATEIQWIRMAQVWQMDGVDGLPSGTSLKVSATSGLNVSVAAGDANIRGVHYRNSSAKTIGLATNNAASARIDRIVVRVNTSTNVGTIDKITGTAASNPVAPDMTYTDTTFDLSLATVRVEANDTISTVTDKRTFVGRPVVFCTSQNRPDSRGRPLLAFETDTNRVIYTKGDNNWRVGIGQDVFRASYDYSGSKGHTTRTDWTSVLADSLAPGIVRTFTAPPSGIVDFTFGAFLGNNANNQATYLGLRLVAEDGSTYWAVNSDGTADRYMSVNIPPNSGGAGIGGSAASAVFRATSLDPGVDYTGTLMYRVSGGEATIDSRFLRIDPQP